MNKYDFSIIIPACNEEENLDELFLKLEELNASLGFAAEVVLVNDGSTDKTGVIAEMKSKNLKWFKICHHSRRMGITSALATGQENASSDIFVFFPADLQFDVFDIPLLTNGILEDKYDIVTGRKIGIYNKKFVSSIYNNISRLLFQVPVKDMNSIKAYRKNIVNNIPLRKDWHRYIVVLAYDNGARVSEVDVKLYPRKSGKSKFGFWRIPVGVLDLLGVFSEIRIMKKPMLIFGTIGGLSMLVGLLTGIIAMILRFFGVGLRPLLYLVMLLILGGFSSFTFGILGETIAGIYKRQESILKKIYEKDDKNKKNKL